MPNLILVIETSTRHTSVALITTGAIVVDASVTSHNQVTGARVEGLMPTIAACFERAQATPMQLSSVVCSAGPGSFTSLRSAAALAKGFCSVLNIPLYAVSAMELLVATAELPVGRYIAALDAGRGEYYVSNVDAQEGIANITPSIIISGSQLHTQAREQHATLVGPGLDIDIFPRASAALMLIARLIVAGPVPVDTWEPSYGRLAEAQVKWEATHGRLLVL